MKRNLLKKFVFAAVAVFALAACGSKNEVDQRDAFVGAYAYTATFWSQTLGNLPAEVLSLI